MKVVKLGMNFQHLINTQFSFILLVSVYQTVYDHMIRMQIANADWWSWRENNEK